MQYAQIQNGQFVKQFDEFELVKWDANNYCTAKALINDGKAAQFGVVDLEVIDPPVIDPITQSVERDGAQLVNGTWQYKWKVIDLSAEQIATNRAASAQQMFKRCDQALTEHLDKTAQAKRYDNRITCMVRAGFAGPFQAEAQAFAVWADTCNQLAYQFLQEVQAGTRPLPTDPQELIDALPAMVWPN